MSTVRRVSTLAASGAAFLLAGGLWLGSGVAAAGDAPAPNTPDCAALVAKDAQVKAAVAARDAAAVKLNALASTDPGFAAAQQLVVTLGATADDVAAKATVRLCTGPVETTDPTTQPTTDPSETTTAPPSTTQPTPSTDPTPPIYADVKDCEDFATRDAAQAYYDAHTTPADPDPSKLDPNGNGVVCEASEVNPRGGGTSGGIDPTQDDGSIADTDGSQVLVVPRGSVDTGDGSTEIGTP